MQAMVFDVFCSDRASGNPAAVCSVTHWPSDDDLKFVAVSQKAPVTAFILQPSESSGPSPVAIRWFAGAQEINLCGHGSLAAGACVLLQQPQLQEVWLNSCHGNMTVARSAVPLVGVTAASDCFAMQLPAWPAQRPAALAEVLDFLDLSSQGLAVVDAFATRDLVLVLANAAQVRAYVPDFSRLQQLASYHALILTAPLLTSDGAEVMGYGLRYFAPKIGINEDIATGSAQCSLAPYWQERLQLVTLQVEQWSDGGGYFQVQQINPKQIVLQAQVRPQSAG